MKLSNILSVLLILFFATLSVFAQGNGQISGKIIDGENGELLRGASIQLVDTKKGAKSDMKGTFKIKDIPSGRYSLRISYVGYTSKEIMDIDVNEDNRNIGDIVLENSEKTTGELVVTANRINDNQAALLSQRKNASQLSDGISMEEIKKTPDSDAGQSLRRVSGITLINEKFVYVRGISERYSNTTLNGTALATTEPDKKAFAFDMFPADFLENANVTKSFTPELPGNFAGGLVQLNTVDFPQGFSLKFSSGASMTDNLTFKNNFVTYNGGNTDWLGFDDGTRSMGSNIPSSPEDFKQLKNDLKSTDEATLIKAQNKWLAINQTFNSDVWKRDTVSPRPNGNYSLSYTDIFSLGENYDLGIMASGMYGSSYSLRNVERGQLQSDGQNFNYYANGEKMAYSTNLGGLFNIAFKLGDNNSISLKNTYNNSSDDEVAIMEGYKESNFIRQYAYDFVQKTLFSSQLGGEHRFSEFFNSTLNWKLGYSNSLRDEPDFRRVRYARNDINEPYRVDIQDGIENSGYQAGRFFSNLKENAYSASTDFAMVFDNLKIKVGGLLETKNRDFNVRSFTIVRSNFLLKDYYDADFGYVVPNYGDEELYDSGFLGSPDELFNSANFGINKLGYSEETKPTDSYKADELLTAGYIMADIPFQFLNKKVRLITGFRLENSNQKLYSYYQINNKDSVFTDKNQLDVLPALNFTYELNNDMNLRLSASQTLTRPSLREYAPFTFYDFEFQGDVTGNPNLKRALIQNYDIRWEWFISPGEVLSVSTFYKSFENAIEETIIPTSSNFKRTFTNAEGTAYNYGIEFEARKGLDFIGDYMKYFMLNMNFALINSEIEVNQVGKKDKRTMCGQSPYTLNLGLFYFNPEIGTSVNLGYNVYGKRIIQVADVQRYNFGDPHVYELPRNVIDLSISQNIFENFEIKFVAKDILNEKLIWEQHGQRVASDYKGKGYSLSFSYKFK